MSYLEEIKSQIIHRDLSKLLVLWEEYCANDRVDVDEYLEILQNIKNSDLALPFGKYVENSLPIWNLIDNEDNAYQVLKLILDLQTTNSPTLADMAFDMLKKRYANDPQFNERIRLVGLRNRQTFQGALANYDLLFHMAKGNFVFHIGGWDAGEIVDVSPVREQLAVEFEFVTGSKHFTFTNAFKTLIPLPSNHFYSRRFSNPDKLEKEARDNPLEVMHCLLKDLGPKTAAEIKDELCELVIPEKDWSKWWQWTRTKLKKDPLIESPQSLKQPFKLRKAQITEEDMLQQALKETASPQEIILQCYNLVRDIPAILKNTDVNKMIRQAMRTLYDNAESDKSVKLQVSIFFENTFNETLEESVASIVKESPDILKIVDQIEILAYKKRAFVAIRDKRADWIPLFLELFHTVTSAPLRDYVIKELNEGEAKEQLNSAIKSLLDYPSKNPELFVWYFQKLVSKDNQDLPFADKYSLQKFFEAFLILFNQIEIKPEYRDLVKKMYAILSGHRFAVVRQLLENAPLEFVKEYLLLISKCQTLTDHDVKILRSLAEVVQPSLAAPKKNKSANMTDGHIIWTTEEGYFKIKEKLNNLGTVEIVDNAREIEEARSHGDLRENSEYKFALERRSQLQSQLKLGTEQLNRARVITKEDISPNEVCVGSIVKLQNKTKDELLTYSILGPWDADVEKGILSFQSQIAQTMMGLKKGDSFKFRDDEYIVLDFHSYLN